MGMTTSMVVVIIICSSLWVSMMTVTVITLTFRRALELVAPLVCRRGEEMTFFIGKASYHRPGERGLLIQCEGAMRSRIVTLRTVLLAWIVLSILMMIVGAVVVVAIRL
jgi:hypothetical protein